MEFQASLGRKPRIRNKRRENIRNFEVDRHMSTKRKNINRVYDRASEWRRERATEADRKEDERKAKSNSVQECRFDKHLGFLFSKMNLWKALFQAWTERGIRQRHSGWKTQTFLYTSCAFTCQSAAIKLLPHGQYAKILNCKGLKGCLWKS